MKEKEKQGGASALTEKFWIGNWKMRQESKSIPCRAKGGNGRRK